MLYKNMVAVDELPPVRKHYMKLRMDARALVVLRNSRRGKWTRYAWFTSKETAVSKGNKYRQSESFSEVGDLLTEVRFDPGSRRWILFLRFDTIGVTDQDIEENIADAGGSEALDRLEVGDLPAG